MRKLSPRMLAWALRLYPPLLCQRIWVRKFYPDFRRVDVVLKRSVFNRNSNGSIFGGTIFSATDPFYALLFEQLVLREGYKPIVWLKSAEIEYLKPARSTIRFSVSISDADWKEALDELRESKRFVKSFPIELYDEEGEIVALVKYEIYIRIKD